eukprot:TRINITY_DN192_c0_g3_i1.p1 TRINITY_DN192_c0_g3~~TRINITY_DN192_c0_g3_i1.p1  ORF type:complete len:360 (-),score=63.79 TRINITY_DN192_c0_g3_i1:67-1146(-)
MEPTTIHCKIFCADQIRRLPLTDPSFANLQTSLRQLFPFADTDEINIKYKDDEGDLVTISSNPELENAISIAGPNTILRLHVFATSPNAPPLTRESVKHDQAYTKETWKAMKHDRKEHKKQLKKHKKDGSWRRHGSDLKRRCKSEKKEWKKMERLAKKNPEKLEFIAKYDSAFEPGKTVVVSKLPNTPLTFNIIAKNLGSEIWPVGTLLKSVGKCKIFASAPSLSFPEPLNPAATIPITLNIGSPEFGVHVSKWRLFLPDGRKFGPKLKLKIRASNADVDKRRKVCARRGRGRGCRGRGNGGHREVGGGRFAEEVQKLKDLGYEGPETWRLVRRFRGDINQVLDHLKDQTPVPPNSMQE